MEPESSFQPDVITSGLYQEIINEYKDRLNEFKVIDASDGSKVRELTITEEYSVAHARFPTNTAPHMLVDTSETYVCVKGRGILHIGDETVEISKGSVVTVPPGEKQWFEVRESSDCYLFVSPPYDPEKDINV